MFGCLRYEHNFIWVGYLKPRVLEIRFNLPSYETIASVVYSLELQNKCCMMVPNLLIGSSRDHVRSLRTTSQPRRSSK